MHRVSGVACCRRVSAAVSRDLSVVGTPRGSPGCPRHNRRRSGRRSFRNLRTVEAHRHGHCRVGALLARRRHVLCARTILWHSFAVSRPRAVVDGVVGDRHGQRHQLHRRARWVGRWHRGHQCCCVLSLRRPTLRGRTTSGRQPRATCCCHHRWDLCRLPAVERLTGAGVYGRRGRAVARVALGGFDDGGWWSCRPHLDVPRPDVLLRCAAVHSVRHPGRADVRHCACDRSAHRESPKPRVGRPPTHSPSVGRPWPWPAPCGGDLVEFHSVVFGACARPGVHLWTVAPYPAVVGLCRDRLVRRAPQRLHVVAQEPSHRPSPSRARQGRRDRPLIAPPTTCAPVKCPRRA